MSAAVLSPTIANKATDAQEDRRRMKLLQVVSSALALLEEEEFEFPLARFPSSLTACGSSLSYYTPNVFCVPSVPLAESPDVLKCDPLRQHASTPTSIQIAPDANLVLQNSTKAHWSTKTDHKSKVEKRVHFATDHAIKRLDEERERPTLSDEECMNCWWGREFLSSIKQGAQQVVESCRNSSKGSKLVQRTIEYTRDLVERVANENSPSHQTYPRRESVLFEESARDVDRLVQWCRDAHARRGLEVFLTRGSVERIERRNRNIRASIVQAHISGMASEQIAILASEGSLADRMYARMMGIADAQSLVV
jgi:hypothetical protein